MNTPKSVDGITPSPLVHAALSYAPKGRALELGAGSGRNGIFIAHNGYDVTAVDSNGSGLEVAAYAAKLAGLSLEVKQIAGEIILEGEYELIVSTLQLQLIDVHGLVETIRPLQDATVAGGVNVIIVALDRDTIDAERVHEFVTTILQPLYNGWEILSEEIDALEQFADDQRMYHRAGLIARKKS
ncbi:MAG: methyltransferase domain-containing protein [Candidatus Saccharibacteria bacterium]